jgi:hypothetical protein
MQARDCQRFFEIEENHLTDLPDTRFRKNIDLMPSNQSNALIFRQETLAYRPGSWVARAG